MADISLVNITKFHPGSTKAAVADVSLAIPSGGFLTLLGPSGCGKSSTLRIVAGLSQPDQGRVLMDGRDVTSLDAQRRNIGMVFQSLALFPHMTVAANVAFGLRMRGVAAGDIATRVRRMLDVVGLAAYADRRPHQLSGGQQQRVALARALVIEPSVLILDEPFSALDRKLREAMQLELYRLTRELGITALFVTHDQEEALALSDQIAVMRDGQVEQCGSPRDLHAQPRTRFVAEFMGISNFLPVKTLETPAGRQITAAGVPFDVPPFVADRPVREIALRPEGLQLRTVRPEGAALAGVLKESIFHGTQSSFTVALADGSRLTARCALDEPPTLGMPVWLTWSRDAVHAFAEPA